MLHTFVNFPPPTLYYSCFRFPQIPASGNYQFFVTADDYATLYMDGALLGSAFSTLSVYLTQGYHLMEVQYLQMTGAALFAVQWDAGKGTVRWLKQ